MEFGICIPHYGKALDVQKIIENTQYAEKLGFDSVWVTDHIIVPRSMDLIYRDNMLEPMALLSHLAGLVPRVKLGTSVLILPYRNPIVLAKMLATIDQLSGGRLIVGVGGGWMTEEFAALNTPYPERGKLSDEYLRVMRKIWTHETVSFHGQYTTFDDLQVSPLPAQPHLPLWVGGVSPRARRRAAEFGDGWHATSLPPETVSEGVQHLKKLWAKNGRAGEPVISMRAPLFIEGVSQDVLAYAPRPGRDLLRGELETVTARVQAYQKAGVQHLVLELSMQSFESSARTMETFMSKIKPKLN
ncbi:MAG: LLM class F420-dependent oxidoreductase [Deltaproteobacteria bacterium]|nr:LLM class F420-dependent oxidoreductase [Deltaproteobacteria bacterium]